MKKSINDLMRQADRIDASIQERGGFRVYHIHLDKQALYQMARSIAARRGLSYFGDKNKKGEWRADMWKDYPTLRAAEISAESATASVEQRAENGMEEQDERKALTDEERIQMEVKMNDVCNEYMMRKVLSWVLKDMMLKMQIGLPGDPMEIPLRLIAEMKAIVPDGYQSRLF